MSGVFDTFLGIEVGTHVYIGQELEHTPMKVSVHDK